MNQDVHVFRKIIQSLLDKGGKITKICKEVGITPITMSAIIAGKPTNYRASTLKFIQDFNKKHEKENIKTSPKEQIPTNIDDIIDNSPEVEDMVHEANESEEPAPNYGEMNMVCKLKDFLNSIPSHIKVTITLSK
jgi:hypothetical protein